MNRQDSPLIRLEGVSKIYYTEEVETHALREVDLEIRSGEYVSIAGPSGCGKSTLLAILGLLEAPSAGRYRLRGRAVEKLTAGERARIRNREIGFIFQAFHLIGDLTVYENVELPLTYRGMPAGERRRRVEQALERVGMAQRRKHYPAQLSGGQQQRVAVARALANRPNLVLADEPTGALDARNARQVLELIRSLCAEVNAALLLVSHDRETAGQFSRVLNLSELNAAERAATVRERFPAGGKIEERR